MSTDRPSGRGDHRPDHTPRPEHKPFPGQPDNRPPVPPPTGTKTPDEMRAERAKYKTNSEYLAAKAAEKAAVREAAVKDTAPAREATALEERARTPDGCRPPGSENTPQQGQRGGGEATAESAPDRAVDGQRLPDMERLKAELLAKVREELKAEFEAENQELKQRVSDLETRLEVSEAQRQGTADRVPGSGERLEPTGSPDVAEREDRSDVVGTGDSTGDNADPSDIDVVNQRLGSEADREAAPRYEERPLFSPDDLEFAKSVAGLAESAGISIPGADLVFGGDSTRRAMEKMPPEDQFRIQKVGEAIGILVSGMSPEAAAAVVITSVVGPAMYMKARDKAHDLMDRIRRRG